MSHQNADEKNSTKSETSPKTDRELAIALRAMALATQDPSPIFQLNVDCWEEIFDWLSMTDLHAFGQTCTFFNRIAGKYFEWKYKRILVAVYNNEMTVRCKTLEGFNEFAQRLIFIDSKPDTSLLHASANCKSPKELKIVYVHSTAMDIKRLEKMLSSIEVLTFINLFKSDELMESILKLCVNNLKRLTIDKSTGCDWMHLRYPKLQHLELRKVNSAQELVKLFEANPNVRSFSTDAEYILKYQSEFMASTIKLDDLTVLGENAPDGISNAFNDLHNRDFYKRLHFTTTTKKHLADLPGLTTLDIGTDDYIDLPLLPNVTRLCFQPLWNGLDSCLNMDEVTNALPNLKCVLMHNEANMKFIMPFIRNSKRLKIMKIKFFRNDHNGDIDPVLMNSEREKLDGAHKVIINVEEKDYLRIKWKYNKSDFGLIQFKRRESYDGVLDYSFDLYYELRR